MKKRIDDDKLSDVTGGARRYKIDSTEVDQEDLIPDRGPLFSVKKNKKRERKIDE